MRDFDITAPYIEKYCYKLFSTILISKDLGVHKWEDGGRGTQEGRKEV